MATLTYVYAKSLAVVSPLVAIDSPHSWDLCERHAARITAPRNWELIREFEVPAAESAGPAGPNLATPHRAAAAVAEPNLAGPGLAGPDLELDDRAVLVEAGSGQSARRPHLRVLPAPGDEQLR